MKKFTDSDRLDLLQELASYGKGWVLRDSESGRGLRLHESSREDATPNIRTAIDNYLELKTCRCGQTIKKPNESWMCEFCGEGQAIY